MDCNAFRSSKKTKDVQFLFENLFLKKIFCCLKVGILPVKTPFSEMKSHYFFPYFGRTP